MGMNPNLQLVEQCHIVTGFAPGTPSTTTPDYVSLKGYNRCAIVILVDNGNTVTGSAITVKQNSNVTTSGESAVVFTKAYRNVDTGASDTLVEFDVTSNTFTTDTTNAKNLLYVIDVTPDMLDAGNDCIRAGTGDAANTVLGVLYFLYKKYSGAPSGHASAIID